MCADRRFHSQVEEMFREATGLSETDYWIEATAGGSPAIEDPKTANYAHSHGARIMGWAAHGSNCGGYPEVGDEDMRKKLGSVVEQRQTRYPAATHFKIFSTESNKGEPQTTIEKVSDGQK